MHSIDILQQSIVNHLIASNLPRKTPLKSTPLGIDIGKAIESCPVPLDPRLGADWNWCGHLRVTSLEEPSCELVQGFETLQVHPAADKPKELNVASRGSRTLSTSPASLNVTSERVSWLGRAPPPESRITVNDVLSHDIALIVNRKKESSGDMLPAGLKWPAAVPLL